MPPFFYLHQSSLCSFRFSLILNPLKKLYALSIASVLAAVLLWTILFIHDAHIHVVLTDIHSIYLSSILAYLIIRFLVNSIYFDLIKIFVRILFRVWLFIFITLIIVKSMDRVGLILSVTFLFGYFEGCMDIDKWVQQYLPLNKIVRLHEDRSKVNIGLSTVFFMSLVHIICAFIVFVFAKFLM